MRGAAESLIGDAVRIARLWVIDRPDARARVSFDMALLHDNAESLVYEVRIRLNGELAYARLWDSDEAALLDADDALEEFLAAGWLFLEDPLASRS